MRVLLHMVLHKLAEEPHTGYSLCSAIESSTGNRPSYGSVYPLLERLLQERSVTVRREGRKKIYSLTASGKRQLQAFEEKRHHLLENMQSSIRTLAEILDIEPGPMLFLMERLKRGEQPLGSISTPMFELRNLIFEMAQDGRAERNKDTINRMLKQMTVKLKRLR